MKSLIRIVSVGSVAAALAACAISENTPTAPTERAPLNAWGPETPNFNLEVILRGDGVGRVKFRQPNDNLLVVELGTTVRELEPNTAYVLQRAVDTNVDDNCTSTAWLTLGKGLVAQTITTDDRGTGHEDLFRSVAAFPVGMTFDIHFRVVNVATSAVVLTSDCYQFTISQ